MERAKHRNWPLSSPPSPPWFDDHKVVMRPHIRVFGPLPISVTSCHSCDGYYPGNYCTTVESRRDNCAQAHWGIGGHVPNRVEFSSSENSSSLRRVSNAKTAAFAANGYKAYIIHHVHVILKLVSNELLFIGQIIE